MTHDAPKKNIGIVTPEEALNHSGMELLAKMRLGELPSPPFIDTMKIHFTKLEDGEVTLSTTPSFDFYNNRNKLLQFYLKNFLSYKNF